MNDKTPPVASESGGIAIASVPQIVLSQNAVFPLYGSFVLAEKDAAKFEKHLLQAAVIVIRGPEPAVKNVGEGQLLFESDLRKSNGRISGCFNLDLFEFFNLARVPNRYHVSASIFQHVSEVLTIDVVDA